MFSRGVPPASSILRGAGGPHGAAADRAGQPSSRFVSRRQRGFLRRPALLLSQQPRPLAEGPTHPPLALGRPRWHQILHSPACSRPPHFQVYLYESIHIICQIIYTLYLKYIYIQPYIYPSIHIIYVGFILITWMLSYWKNPPRVIATAHRSLLSTPFHARQGRVGQDQGEALVWTWSAAGEGGIRLRIRVEVQYGRINLKDEGKTRVG